MRDRLYTAGMHGTAEVMTPPLNGDNGHTSPTSLGKIIQLEVGHVEGPRDLEALGIQIDPTFRNGIVIVDPALQEQSNPPDNPITSLRVLEPSRLIVDDSLRVIDDPDDRFVLNVLLNNRGKSLKPSDFVLSPHFAPNVTDHRNNRAAYLRRVMRRLQRTVHPSLIVGTGNNKARTYDLDPRVHIDPRERLSADRVLVRQIVHDYVRGDTLVTPRFAPSAWADVRSALSMLVGDEEFSKGEKSRFKYMQELVTVRDPNEFVLHEGYTEFISRLALGRDMRQAFERAACVDAPPERFHIQAKQGKYAGLKTQEEIEDTITTYCDHCRIREECLEFGVRTTGTGSSNGGIRIFGGVAFGRNIPKSEVPVELTQMVERVRLADEVAALAAAEAEAERAAAAEAAEAKKAAEAEEVKKRVQSLK